MESLIIIKSSNLSYKDFRTICRICLSKENLSEFNNNNLLLLFQNVTNIKIEPEDELPKNVCESCFYQLQNISYFIDISKCSDITLRRILSEVNESAAESVLFESDVDDREESLDSFDKNKIIVKNEELDPSHSVKQENTSSDLSQPGCTKLTRHSIKIQLIKCEICGDSFSTKGEFTRHQRNNINCKIKPYKCGHCEKTFFMKFRLKIHMRTHTRETPYECKICFKKFRHSPNLKRHDDIVHKGLKPFKCEVCGKEFATFLRRTEHMRTHTGERPHICSYCGKGFKKYSTRYAHEMRHKIKNGEMPKNDKKPKKYLRKKPDDPAELECKTCKKHFSSRQALNVHTKIHIGEKSFLCNVCGKGFLRKSHLEVHVRIHTGEKPYQCNDCGKNFRQAACFRNHLLIHKGERSYKCDVCQRSFIQLGHLQSHLKTHTGEKPYKCSFCDKSFAQNGNLKAHTRIHTGERPYRCGTCCMGFYDSTTLKKHKKAHEDVDENGDIFVEDNYK